MGRDISGSLRVVPLAPEAKVVPPVKDTHLLQAMDLVMDIEDVVLEVPIAHSD